MVWGYEGSEIPAQDWPSHFPCGCGSRQSPINIDLSSVQYSENLDPLKLNYRLVPIPSTPAQFRPTLPQTFGLLQPCEIGYSVLHHTILSMMDMAFAFIINQDRVYIWYSPHINFLYLTHRKDQQYLVLIWRIHMSLFNCTFIGDLEKDSDQNILSMEKLEKLNYI